MKNFNIARMLVALAITCIIGNFSTYAGASRSRNDIPRDELARLNKAIKSAGLYMRDETERLDSLTRAFNEEPKSNYSQRWQLCHRLTRDYLSIRADSSLRYSEMAIRIAMSHGMEREAYESRIARINALSTAGIFTRALAEFSTLDTLTKDQAMKISYWLAGRKLFGYMRVYVQGDEQFFNEYTDRYLQYDDSLLANLPSTDPTRSFYYAERLVNQGNFDQAKGILLGLCSNMPEEDNLYGMAAFQLGIVCKAQGDQTEYASWLAKAAISDIKGCVKDGLALPALAEWLYHEGELNTAFQYINFALEEAMSGNVRMRTVTIAALLPLIDEAYREKINASRDELMVYFLLVTFLLIITIALIVILSRAIRRGRVSSAKLARTAEIQESYIGNFIGMCSTYANRLESLQKLVTRKLASGQSEELLRMMKNGKFDEGQNEEFYKIFDSAFLDIYPDFIESVNALLREEERMDLSSKKDKELTPDLRIYAFVRLGIEESTRIAQVLNYSVSTVYSYRNRMRNRAIDRENFDHNVMLIGKDVESRGERK